MIAFTDIFDADEYNYFKYQIHEFLKKTFGEIDTIKVALYLFVYTVSLMTEVCGIEEEWIVGVVKRLGDINKGKPVEIVEDDPPKWLN